MFRLYVVLFLSTLVLMGEEVTLKGFVYPVEENQWVLSDTPNLKSCCVNKHPYTLIKGDIDPSLNGKAVVLTGHYIDNALILTSMVPAKGHFPWVTTLLLSSLLIAGVTCRKVFNKQQ